MASGTKPPLGDAGELVAMLEHRLNAERAERRRLQARLAEIEGGNGAGRDADLCPERLARLVERRTRELVAERDEAVAASRSKGNFLVNMSHEIRTPLTSIIGFAQLLHDPGLTEPERLDAATTIVRNGRHLLEVINDILDMSKIESNQLALERIDVNLLKLLSDIEALASSRAQEKGLLFRIEHHLPLPAALVTDPVRLKQILLNFCSNAVKFSQAGEVRLDVRLGADHRSLCFEVSDTGIGMSDEVMARLFQPFVQADASTSRRFGGTGLGLYISKQLSDLLGGRIRVTSKPGHGSRFQLTIPVGMEERQLDLLVSDTGFGELERPAFQITSIDVPQLSGRVLVAEDGKDNQRLLGSFLRQAGVAYDMVGDGQSAVEHALEREYALVLMDIQMPILDGVSATRILRRSNYRGPIVALTANVLREDAVLYRQSGCTDVLGKPIDRIRFYEVLRTYVDEVKAPPSGCMGDDAYAHELAELTRFFAAGLATSARDIVEAARAADWGMLKSLLHNLRGTAGSYGFVRVAAVLSEAEAALAAGRLEQVQAACARLAAVADAERAAMH